jgi:hypothetical protein
MSVLTCQNYYTTNETSNENKKLKEENEKLKKDSDSDDAEDELNCSECKKGITYDECIHYQEFVYLCEKCGEGLDDICIECYKRPCECEEDIKKIAQNCPK